MDHTTKDIVVKIFQEAGEKLKEFTRSGFTTHSKGGSDFATEADDAIDKFLRDSLSKAFPAFEFLTEETAPDNYDSFVDKENLWVIDPIDGTTNFSRGSSHCAISVGLVDRGIAKLGVIYLPLEEKLYWAQSDGDGAYLNDKPIHVSSTSTLQEALVCCDWSWDLEKRTKTHAVLGRVLPHVRAVECRGSAASDVASLASGNIDAYFIHGLKPWDIGAALLIAQKAGASIMDLHKKEWSIFSPDILVTNGNLHDEIATLIK